LIAQRAENEKSSLPRRIFLDPDALHRMREKMLRHW